MSTTEVPITTDPTSANVTTAPTQLLKSETHDSAIVLFLFGSCAVGALTRWVIQVLNLRLPYTVVLLIVGVLFGLLSSTYDEVHMYTRVVETDPHLILAIFLPVLLFEAAFAMEVHLFIRSCIQVLILAIPGLAVSTVMTCVLARYLFTYQWNWNLGMMFGSILSATDPVAVVALLKDLGASKQLAMVIEGESLLNDGAAIVLFNIFLKLETSDVPFSGADIVVTFLQMSLLGPLFGFIMAKLSLFWLSRIFNDALAEITITLAATYITYYIGEEFMHTSGVLAVVVLGIVMSAERTMISPEVERFLHRFWETLAYLANTLIFIIVGIVISEKAISEIHGIDWFYMFSLYFGCNVIRGFMIALFSPILRHTGYGMSWKEGMVMAWGGLRGALGLTLALQVAHHDNIDQESTGIRFLIHVSGVVFLTLCVNATTIMGLLKVLGMSELSQARKMAMASSLKYLLDMREKTLNMLKTDRFLADAEWQAVEKTTEVIDPYNTKEEEVQENEALDIKPHAHCPDCDHSLPPQYSRKELRGMSNEAILRMLKAEKMSYWRQFEQGMLSREATRKLQECTEFAADKKGKFIDIEEIKKSWEMPVVFGKLKRLVKAMIGQTPIEICQGDMLYPLYRLTRHPAFYIGMYTVICLDLVNMALAIGSEYSEELGGTKLVFRSANVLFLTLYIVEAVLKMLWQRKMYFTNIWHILCLVIIGIGFLDVIISFTLPLTYGDDSYTTHIVLSVFIFLRSIRVFRLIEPLLPHFLTFIKRRMTLHLSYGFDVGRGYVAGEEEVRKLMDHMVDYKEIAKEMKQMSDNSRLDVIRCLGMLSKQHPDIALAIKTKQAIRSVLNIMRDGVNELMMDGILEESEGHKLEKMFEEKMKRLQSTPPSLPVPPPDKMLCNVYWLRNDKELVAYIKEKSKLLSYNYEDVIIREGDPPGGIYIIVSGMVRLESVNPTGKSSYVLQEKPSGSQLHIRAFVLDFMTAGNIIGEMGLLTRKPRSATVIAETSVQVLFISLEDMEVAIDMFHDDEEPLEYRLWHVCAIRIAVNILNKQPTYQGWTKERIKLRLENSFLADLQDNVFMVDSSMSDVVLINGNAENPFTQEKFEGPCYIPWTVFKLSVLPEQDCRTVILVVPSELGTPVHSRGQKTREQQRGHGAFINSISQLCLRHSSKQRLNVQSKWRQHLRNISGRSDGSDESSDGDDDLNVQNAKSSGTLFHQYKLKSGVAGAKGEKNGPNLSFGKQIGVRASTPGRLGSDQALRRMSLEPESTQKPAAKDFILEARRNSEAALHKSTKDSKTSWKSVLSLLSSNADSRVNFEATDSLPESVEYIEGGEIMPRAESPVFETPHHSLTTVAEEVEVTAKPSISSSSQYYDTQRGSIADTKF